MRTRKKYTRIIWTALLFCLPLQFMAAEPENFEEYRYGKNYLSRQVASSEEGALQLLPEFSGKAELLAIRDAQEPDLCIEIRYRMPLPEPPEGTDMRLHLLQSASRFQTMENLHYYSRSRDSIHPLIEKAALVPQLKSKDFQKDPDFQELLRKARYTYYQKDTRFGEVWYAMEFLTGDDYASLSMSNATTMSYLFFPIFKPRGLTMVIVLIPEEEGLTFYAAAYANINSFFGFAVDFEDSFERRLSALQKWLTEQIYRQDP